MTKPNGYSRDGVERALMHHEVKGTIRGWRNSHVTPGHTITLADGSYAETKALHESYMFVMALRSAEVAHERYEQGLGRQNG